MLQLQHRLILLCLVLGGAPAWATESVIVSGNDNPPATGTTEYNLIMGASGFLWTATESQAEAYVAAAGTISDLCVLVEADPDNGGGVDDYTFTVRHTDCDGNGESCGSAGDSSVTVNIADGEEGTGKCDTSNTLAVTAGDIVSLQSVPSGSPAVVGDVGWTIKFDSTTANESLIMGSNGGTTSSSTNRDYGPMGYSEASEANIGDAEQSVAMAGTVSDCYYRIGVSPGSGVTYTYDFMLDQATCNNTCGILGTTDKTCQDLVNTCSVTTGQEFSIRRSDDGAPSASGGMWGCKMTATTAGQFMVAMRADRAFDTTTTEYNHVATGVEGTAWASTEANRLSLGQSMTVEAMFLKLESSISSGSYAVTLREAGADTAAPITCTVTSAECSQTGQSELIGDPVTLTWKVVPSTPSNPRRPGMSFQATIPSVAADRRRWLLGGLHETWNRALRSSLALLADLR